METQLAFPKFVQALRDMGQQDVSGAAFLSDAAAAWRALDVATRASFLASIGMEDGNGDVEIRVSRKPGAPKSLENVFVTLTTLVAAGENGDGAAPAAPLSEAADARPKKSRKQRGKRADGPTDAAPEPEPEPQPFAAAEPEPLRVEVQEPAPQPEPAFEPQAVAAPEPAPQPEPFAAPQPEPEPEPQPFAAAEPEPFAEAALESTVVEATPIDITPAASDEELEPIPPWPESTLQQAAASAAAQPKPASAPAPEAVPTAPSAPPAAPEKKKGLFARLKGGKKDAAPAEEQVWKGPVTEVPKPADDGIEVVEVYPVQEPYAYVRILHDHNANEHRYEVVEPELTDREKNILDFIENTIIDVIEVGLSAMTREQAAELLRKHADEVIYDYSVVLTPLSREKILYYILRDFLGFGKLDPMMRDEYIEDISCDGPGVPIFLYHRKYESIRSTLAYKDPSELDSYVIQMAQRSGKHVSIAEPLLDATLPDGSRLNATLSDEVTARGSTFTIRKFKEDPFTLPDLVRFGTMSEDLLAYWWLAVQNGASAIYAGGTASGKTTSLNAILMFIPPQMKIVSIEDTREINIPHENWIAGVTRAGFGPRDNNGRQAGEIDMFSLLKAALRQRPEYILVGEVRGQEAVALFQAMATGHTAYGTMHADSTEAVIHRLESEPISIPRSLLEALDIVSIQIQTRIGDRRVRRTKELVEIVGLDPHTREILTNEVFKWDPGSDTFEFTGVSYVLERIQMERAMNESDMREEFERRKRIIHWMVAKNTRNLADVGKVISTYYRNPNAIMALVEGDLGIDALPMAIAEAREADAQAKAEAEAEVEAAHGPQ